MARTAVTVTATTPQGVAPAATVGIADGHMFEARGREVVEVRNSGAATRVLTIPTPIQVAGHAVDDLLVSVPAGGFKILGGLDPNIYAQQTGADKGKVYLNYPAGTEAELNVRVYRV